MKTEPGSKSWFQQMFHMHYEYIRNYLYYLSGDIELSEDLSQDVFLQLWENREKVKQDSIRPYLFTIARNSYFKTYRKKKSDLQFKSEFIEQTEHESPEYLMELKEFDSRLQKVISGLPDKCRTIYLMNRIDELTYQQIAENLGVSVKAIEKQMSKALAILRREIGTGI